MEAASLDTNAMLAATSAEEGPQPNLTHRLLSHRVRVAFMAVALGVLAFTSYSTLSDRLAAGAMAVVLVVLAAIDLEHRIIPNRIVLPGAAILLVARLATSPSRTPEFLIATIGAAVAFLLPNLINSKAMGMGDVKLAAFLGAGLGWGVIGAVALAFIATFPFALGTLITRGVAARKSTLPFAPFLALGALVILIVPRLVGLGGS
jgi:leader peptidase (prepilin peptidase) / N-methyltransferase